MKLIIIFSSLISLIFSLTSHPMVMISLISLQTLLMCLLIALSSSSSWFSFILFLVFMGGLMVLFIYVASLASNESFSGDLLTLAPSPYSLIPLMITLFMLLNWQTLKINQISNSTLVFKIYSPGIMFMTALCMIFLLLVLIIIVNITTLKEGSLRSLN